MRIGITCNIQGHAPRTAGAAEDWDEEFDRPETVEMIAAALRELGHEVEVLGDGPPLVRRLLDDPPDFAFNFAEGVGVGRSREARVPAVLEMFGVPYSGSDPLTLAATLDKDCAKRLVQSAGVRTAKWITVNLELGLRHPGLGKGSLSDELAAAGMSFPLFVKPAYEGSSKGVGSKSIVASLLELVDRVSEMAEMYRQPIMVEEFIAGDEFTVGVLGNDPPRVLGLMRVLPKSQAAASDPFVYSIEAKRDWRRLINYETPARVSAEWEAKIRRATIQAYSALGCRDVARVDFRMKDGEPYFLEVNPLPGLHPENGDLVMIARGAGMSHPQLIQSIYHHACVRHRLASGVKSRHPSSGE